MTGLAAAEWLRHHGRRQVVLLESGFCSGGATGRSSGFITPESELQVSDLVRRFEADRARRLWMAAHDACVHIRGNAERHRIDCVLTGAMLTFDAISKGSVGLHGSTGTLHGHTLRRMRVLIDRTLAEVRLGAGANKRERVAIAELLEEIEVVAMIEANDHDIKLSIDAGRADVVVEADQQILASVVANLVQDAFKYTRRNGRITVRAHTTGERVLIDVEDECGGLPPGKAEDLFLRFEQRSVDRSGLGLGLAISLQGARASSGEIRVRDLPGSGCMFTVDLPRAAPTH